MKRIAFLLLCAVATGTAAQSTLNLEAEMAPSFRFNVFNSPEDYARTPGDTLFADSLLVNDAFLYGKFSAHVKWKRGIHRFRLETDAEILRYQNTPSAHATELKGQFKYNRRVSSDRRQGASLRLRKQDRLGLNVLGSELLTPFSFWQAAGAGYVLWKNPADHTFKLEAAYSYKNYKACDGCGQQGENVALDQHEWSVEAQRVWLLGRAHEAKRTLALSVRYRDRQYTDWFNYDLLDNTSDPLAPTPFLPFDSLGTYPTHAWRYVVGKLTWSVPVAQGIELKPLVEYTRRWDISTGDFGFHQYQPGLYVYLQRGKWSAKLHSSYTLRNYTDRLAKQNTPTPYPTLTYTYLRNSLRVDRALGQEWFLWGEVTSANRNSNTSAIDTRVRRSYRNGGVMVGVTWSWEGERTRRTTKVYTDQ